MTDRTLMVVTLHNRICSNGVNVETAQGLDHGGGPEDSYPRESRRLNDGESWAMSVSGGYDLWYRRDRNPDSPQIPADYQGTWDHVVNYSNDEECDLD
jgi:hypothetical protein